MSSCISSVDENVAQFRLVGLAGSVEFQKCLAYLHRLYKAYPKIYAKPMIRGMLEYDWDEYLVKVRRKLGGKLWSLEKKAAVFLNEAYLGTDDDLIQYISSRYRMSVARNYADLARQSIFNLFLFHLDFGLYADLVPKTCYRFMKKCKSKKYGYTGTIVHRIMKAGWIQVGGFKMTGKNHTCENYIVPHNRRGILSMCNDGPNTNNTTQFHVSLNPTPWMDRRYVAFGQLIQGDRVLKQIENVETCYEYPYPKVIRIVVSGEFSLDNEEHEDRVMLKNKRVLDNYLTTIDSQANVLLDLHKDILDPRDKSSQLFRHMYADGDYCFEEDKRTNLPLKNIPSYLFEHIPFYETEIEYCDVCECPDGDLPKRDTLLEIDEALTEKYDSLTHTQIVQEIIDKDILAFLREETISLGSQPRQDSKHEPTHVRFEGVLGDSMLTGLNIEENVKVSETIVAMADDAIVAEIVEEEVAVEEPANVDVEVIANDVEGNVVEVEEGNVAVEEVQE